ncbi:MAG TPA: PAS domain-containing protein [Acidimicrobiales bacterium]|nr:PAS domain-containing protein [Acidimicrobiales bacterium]
MSEHSAQLRRLLAHLQTAHQVAGLGSWEGELDGSRDLYWSPEVYEIFGLPPDHSPTIDTLVRLIHPDDRALFLEARADALQGERPYEIDVRIVRPDGGVRHLQLVAEIVRDQIGAGRLIGTVQDRTEEIEAMRRLRLTEAERRDLLQRLIDTADIERRRLAEHLSAGPIEHLAAVRDRIAEAVATDGSSGLADALDALERSIGSLDAALSTIELEPAHRDLEDLVGELVAETAAADEVHVHVEPELVLGPSLQATAVRVVQEALHNARKHAGATRVAVAIRRDRDDVVIEVSDDGAGFDVDALEARPGHLGLVSMRERVHAVGGELHISSRPGRTTVRARAPLS